MRHSHRSCKCITTVISVDNGNILDYRRSLLGKEFKSTGTPDLPTFGILFVEVFPGHSP